VVNARLAPRRARPPARPAISLAREADPKGPAEGNAACTLAYPTDSRQRQEQTGWASIDGRRVLDLAGNPVTNGEFEFGPALLGVFEQVVRVDFVSGHALHYTGTQDARLPN